MDLVRNTPSHSGEHLWQVIFESPFQWQTSSQEKKLICNTTRAYISENIGGRVMALVLDTLSLWGEHLCNVILKFPDPVQSFSLKKQSVAE